jgi:glutamate-ammonia-ligase adenylyltransferase
MIAGSPTLVSALAPEELSNARAGGRDFRALLRAAVDRERSFRAELGALRRAWSRLVVETAALDLSGHLDLAASNRAQTELATASINVALLVARRELARRHGRLDAGPRLSVLALGRLASGGMDYGSDLDIVLVYDERTAPPVRALAREESYARLAELMTAALSSVTREGHLYRVDLRLRPDGKSGPVARGSESFVSYVSTQADVWEWLAYVKLRAVGGDLELGRAVERRARRAIHEAALKCDGEELRLETRRVRERLERERARGGAGTFDIKFGAGGMLDVYFAARYLQLRDRLPDEGEDRSTHATLARLRAAGSLDEAAHAALSEGYALLRRLDHRLRLTAARSTRLPAAPDHPTLRDLAHALGFAAASDLVSTLCQRTAAIRAAYDQVTSD